MGSRCVFGVGRTHPVWLVLCLGCLAAPPGAARAADCSASRIEPSDAAPGDLFGCAVSLSGNLLAAGSLHDDDGGTDSGSAYVFRRSGDSWSQFDKLLGSDTATGDQFGFSVAASGLYVIVGAPFHRGAEGAAYAFRCSGSCVEEARLSALNPASSDQFGLSVSVDGGTAAVGAPGSGFVEIFQRSGGSWVRRAQLRPSAPTSGAAFGFSVSIRDGTLLVGAPLDGGRGSAYVFQGAAASWVERRKLAAPGAAAGDLFGDSVALSVGTAVVGASGKGGGAAYVFSGSGSAWSPGARLPAAGVSSGDHFGVSVAVDSLASRVLVGARYDDDNGTDAGAAYVFERSSGGWSQAAKLIDHQIRPGDEFGLGAAIGGDVAVVGAFKADLSGANSGVAYSFFLNDDGQPSCGADLEIAIEPDRAEVCPGDVLSYDVTVTNGGPAEALGATVVASFPATLTGVTWTCGDSGGAACDDVAGSGDIAGQSVDLPVGGSLLYAAEATVSNAATGDLTATARVEPAADDEDPETGNNEAEATVNVGCAADLSVSIAADDSDLCSGGILSYVITVANDGATATPGAVISADFDAELEAVTWTCIGTAGATCSAAGGGDIADVVSLPAGSEVIYTATTALATASLALKHAPPFPSGPTWGFRCADFVTVGSNPFFPLWPGYSLVLEGEEEDEDGTVEISSTATVLAETELVAGVLIRIFEERKLEDGELTEVSRKFLAQCRQTGGVWNFGEDVDNYEDGEIIDHNGSWHAGENGAEPGLLMPGSPMIGARYLEGIAPGIALDQAEIVSMGEEITVPAGTFTDTLATEGTDPLDPEEGDDKIYARGVGSIKDGVLELTRITLPDCIPDATTHCLSNGRFKVEAVWKDFANVEGVGNAILPSADSGEFWFFSPGNTELIVKVLDARQVPGFNSFWVFAAGLTSIEVALTVTDTVTGQMKVYENDLGMDFEPILDTCAFACDDIPPPGDDDVFSTSAEVTVPPGFSEATPANNTAVATVEVDCQP